jgi:hypothetical protein
VKTLIFAMIAVSGLTAQAPQAQAKVKARPSIESQVVALVESNDFQASSETVEAVVEAAQAYRLNPLDLTAIAIIETGFGRYAVTRQNKNGTFDRGLFQINTVNEAACKGFDLDSLKGNAFCAAKLLSRIKKRHADYLGRYHSKTPSKKQVYLQKITQVFNATSDK